MNYWRCDACGRANKLDVLVCDGCGSPIPLSQDQPHHLPIRPVSGEDHNAGERKIPTMPKPSRTGSRLA